MFCNINNLNYIKKIPKSFSQFTPTIHIFCGWKIGSNILGVI